MLDLRDQCTRADLAILADHCAVEDDCLDADHTPLAHRGNARPGQYVVQVDDFRNGVAYTNIFLPDGKASRRKGTLVEIK